MKVLLTFLRKGRNSFFILGFIFLYNTAAAQTVKQQKMEQLSFMIGDWVGTSTTYDNGAAIKQVPAFQEINYRIDKNIIVINLHSETLQLHTVIYYDEEQEGYYYHPYANKTRSALPAEFKDGKLIVSASSTKRFIFQKTGVNTFQEYGEQYIDGTWVTYFEDNFTNAQ